MKNVNGTENENLKIAVVGAGLVSYLKFESYKVDRKQKKTINQSSVGKDKE